ncbi:transglutaminase domain-containing protein [Chitinophaga sp. 212800010-3]|uniref:transglutaminase-like domain-containing protein n=1 Tax=unclassified Chitinophaga TaxID=2619133 RepID=UPI002DE37A58|nr:Transglutaminase domain-containing protein [Chitinophaga sp. 212800010-3]
MKCIFLYILALVVLNSCSPRDNTTDRKLAAALDYAGMNAVELKKVIGHYSQSAGDSLKLAAARFLIENMPGKGYQKYSSVTDCGIFNQELFVGDTIGIDSINALKRKIEDSLNCGTIRFDNPVFLADSRTISAKQLIEDIEYAFRAWQMPWARSLTFEQFKEYILPHRVQNEPLQNWRKHFWENSGWIFEKAGHTTDRIKIAAVVNDSLGRYYHYIHDAINYFPGTFTVRELRATRGGRCEDLNMLLGYWLRAIGIPVANEFTSYWANGNFGGHTWLSVLDTTGKFVPMNAVYDSPVRDSLPFKSARLAKAYRYTYKTDGSSFPNDGRSFQVYYDITREYLPVIDYAFKVPASTPDEIFLGVLNGKYWKPLRMKVTKKNDTVIFSNIAAGALYAPIIVLGGNDSKTRTVGTPFLVTENSGVQYINENKQTIINVSLDISRMSGGLYHKKCQLVYWDNIGQSWIPVGPVQTLMDDPAKLQKEKVKKLFTFSGIPAYGIYRVINTEITQHDKSYGRPFLYNREMQAYADY